MEVPVHKATFGAGCFWGAEAKFRRVGGIKDVSVGYMGGRLSFPTYGDVCRGDTGHTEVVQIIFEPNEISFNELLGVFWNAHDSTDKGKQEFNGGQYKSVVFYHDEEQKREAIERKKELNESNKFGVSVLTEVLPVNVFYRAEETHQKYLEKIRKGVC